MPKKRPPGYIRSKMYYILDESNLLKPSLYRVYFKSEKEALFYIYNFVPQLRDYSILRGSEAIESHIKLKSKRNVNGYVFPLRKTLYPSYDMTRRQRKRFRGSLRTALKSKSKELAH